MPFYSGPQTERCTKFEIIHSHTVNSVLTILEAGLEMETFASIFIT